MSQHSAIHFYLNWAKERIDEMDATLASLKAKVSDVQLTPTPKPTKLSLTCTKSVMTFLIL